MSRSQSPTTLGGNGQAQWPQQGAGQLAQPQRQGAPQAAAWPGQPPQPAYRGQPTDANGQPYYPSLDPRQAPLSPHLPPPQAHDYAPQFAPSEFGSPAHAQMSPSLMAQGAAGWVGGVVPQPEAPYPYAGGERTAPPPPGPPQQSYGRPAADYPAQHPQYAQPQYAPEPQYSQQPQYAQESIYAQPAQPQYTDPRTGPPHQPQGYDSRGHDPRGYDLGNYAPAANTPQMPGSHGPAYGQPAYGQAYPEAYPQQSYAAQGQPAAAAMGFGNAHVAQQHGYDDELAPDGTEEYEDDDEPRSGGRKWLMVGAALVVALAVGGGGMYAYKVTGVGGLGKMAMFQGKSGSPPPTIAADKTPTKSAPDEAGGRDFANKEMKLYERFGETRTADASAAPVVPGMVVIPPPQQQQNAPADAGDPSAPRSVKTIPILPSGQQMQPSMAAPAQPLPRVPNATVRPNNGPLPQVPGLSLEGLGGRSGLGGDTQNGSAATPQMPPAQKPVVRTAAVTTPSGLGAGQVGATQAVASPPPAVKKVAAKPPGAPVPKATAQTANAGGGGYVAWVTSHQNQADAIAQFAGLKQKYPDLMANKQPDIKTADLKDKGTWYRVRIGPTGTKAEMDELCLKLKASGVKDCFPQHQ